MIENNTLQIQNIILKLNPFNIFELGKKININPRKLIKIIFVKTNKKYTPLEQIDKNILFICAKDISNFSNKKDVQNQPKKLKNKDKQEPVKNKIKKRKKVIKYSSIDDYIKDRRILLNGHPRY